MAEYVDWASEVESSEKDITERIFKLIDELANNEKVSIAITDMAEQYNIPEDIEHLIKSMLFTNYKRCPVSEKRIFINQIVGINT
jgi:hypothetical protein